MVLDKSSSKKAFAGKKVRYLSYLLAGALSREGQLYLQDGGYRSYRYIYRSDTGVVPVTYEILIFKSAHFSRHLHVTFTST